MKTLFKSGDVDVTLLNETFLNEKKLLNDVQPFNAAAGGL